MITNTKIMNLRPISLYSLGTQTGKVQPEFLITKTLITQVILIIKYQHVFLMKNIQENILKLYSKNLTF